MESLFVFTHYDPLVIVGEFNDDIDSDGDNGIPMLAVVTLSLCWRWLQCISGDLINEIVGVWRGVRCRGSGLGATVTQRGDDVVVVGGLVVQWVGPKWCGCRPKG